MILVDKLQLYNGRLWCHLASDTSAEELHQFATWLRLSRRASQERPRATMHHYDLTPRSRLLAVSLGAIEVSSKELVQRNYDRQKKG